MIIGVGTDIIEIDRIRKLMEGRTGEAFLTRLLTEEERRMAVSRKGKMYEFVSGRFAVKEAVVKALGCGIGEKVGFHDILVYADKQGKPICALSDEAKHRLGYGDGLRLWVSISHSEAYATAMAIAEQV